MRILYLHIANMCVLCVVTYLKTREKIEVKKKRKKTKITTKKEESWRANLKDENKRNERIGTGVDGRFHPELVRIASSEW